MGRKSKLEIRVTESEYAQIKGLADKSGKTISDYCRDLLGLSLSGQKGLVSVRTENKKVSGQENTLTVRTEPKPVEKPNNSPSWLKGVEESRKRLEERKRAVK